MTTSPSISVVIPTRGREEVLRQAVTSVLDQRYDGEIECIVVVDGNADELSLAPGETRPRRSVKVVAGPHGNPAAARNLGARLAGGELLAFCDDDDEWLPDKSRLQLEGYRATEAVAATCGINVHYGSRVVTRLPARENVVLEDLLRSRRADMHTSTILVPRDAFLSTAAIGPFDEEIPASYGEDYDWLLRAARHGVVRAIREPLVNVHWHAGSYFDGRWPAMIEGLEHLLRKHPEFRRDASGLSRIHGQIAFAYAASGDVRESRRWVRRCLSADWRQPRGYLALAASLGIAPPALLLRLLHRAGRGI